MASDNKIFDKGRVLINNIIGTQKSVNKIFFMTDNVTEEKFNETFPEGFVIQVKLDDINLPAATMKRLSRSANARLMAHDLITVNEVIYLDIDILLREDITHVEFREKPIMGVHDNGWKTLYNWEHFLPLRWVPKIFKKWRGFNGYEYVNTGVLWMNLEKLRGNDFITELFEFSNKYKTSKMLDQDFINYKFQGNIEILPRTYNTTAYEFNNWKNGKKYKRKEIQPKVIHFTGRKKPWNSNPKFTDEWKKYENIN